MGRHIRKMTIEQATATASRVKANAVTCERCQYYKYNWCSVFAKRVGAFYPACKYGHVAISAAKQTEKRKGKRK